MNQEVLLWLEQYVGITYDFNDVNFVDKLSGVDMIFYDSFTWKITLDGLLDKLTEALDSIEEHRSDIPDDLPPCNTIKKQLTTNVVEIATKEINEVKRLLSIEPQEISTLDDLYFEINTLYDFVTMFKLSLEVIIKKDMLTTFNYEHNNILTDNYSVSSNDLSSLKTTVSSSIEAYWTALAEADDE